MNNNKSINIWSMFVIQQNFSKPCKSIKTGSSSTSQIWSFFWIGSLNIKTLTNQKSLEKSKDSTLYPTAKKRKLKPQIEILIKIHTYLLAFKAQYHRMAKVNISTKMANLKNLIKSLHMFHRKKRKIKDLPKIKLTPVNSIILKETQT